MDIISLCDFQFKNYNNDPLVKSRITGKEKCIVYNNVDLKRSRGETKRATISNSKKQFSSEGGTTGGIEGQCV